MTISNKKSMDRPLGIDLFAGAGGLSLGFEQAGFDVAVAVEIDPIHAAVHKFNFPDCAVLARSITDITGDDLRLAGGFGSRRVDVVFGGPPCQGFSLIGHRALDDSRNVLVREFVRIVDELKPNYFVFENVKGLTVGRHKAFLDELIEAFGDIGYSVRLPWKVLDAADYGVPQHRQRLILMGARNGLRLPEYPEALYSPQDRKRIADLPLGPSCGDALDDMPNADLFEALLQTDEVQTEKWEKPSLYAQEMRGLSNDSWHFGHPREWKPSFLTSSVRTQHSEISQRRFRETQPGTVEPISRLYKLSPNGLCNTLRAGTDAARGAFTSPRPVHYAYPRCVTVREMARLHGFPDWFRFNWTKWHGARQIGNSVPPPLARAIASQIMAALKVVPTRPDKALPLGDPLLVQFDMSAAARHFGVEMLANKRDRKSGAKKRKQHEIEALYQAQLESSVV